MITGWHIIDIDCTSRGPRGYNSLFYIDCEFRSAGNASCRISSSQFGCFKHPWGESYSCAMYHWFR